MRAIGLDDEEYLETYSQPILVRPTRFLPWHGRTVPASAQSPRGGVMAALRDAAGRIAGGLRRPAPALAG
jgi:hypothetical protein